MRAEALVNPQTLYLLKVNDVNTPRPIRQPGGFLKNTIMENQFMPEIKDRDEKLRLLKDNCDSWDEDVYLRSLTQNELDQRREQLADNCIEQNRLEDELDGIKKNYKGQIDPLKKQNKSLLSAIKTRQEEKEGKLFHFHNHDDGYRYTYDETGELIATRRLKPEEKQARLFIQPAANDQ